MILQLSNFATECEPRRVNVPGNPLLTYQELRAGDGVPGSRGGDGRTLAEYRPVFGQWVWLEDGSRWTDIEVISTDGVVASQVSV